MMLDILSQVYSRYRYSPFLCQLIVTRRCNLACKYCYEFDQISEAVPAPHLRQSIDKITQLGSFGLEFTGGEPLLHPEMIELVRYAKRYPFRMVGMISNGFLLTEKIIEGLNEAGLTDLQISVDGVEPNEITMKTLRPLRPKLEILARLAQFKVVLSAVVGSGAPYEEVVQVVNFAREHGFRPRILLIHNDDGQLDRSVENLKSYRNLQRLIGRHYKDFFDYRERLFVRGEAPFRCRAGSRYLYIDEAGIAHWCSQTQDEFGKPLQDYTAEDLRQQFYTYKDCNRRCTIGCVRSCSMPDFIFPQKRS